MAEPTYFGAHLASMSHHSPLPLAGEGPGEREGVRSNSQPPSPQPSPASGRGSNSVAIVGGGPAGMALALALHRHGIDAVIHDARPRGAARGDQRVLALSHGSQQTFEWLGVWPRIAPAATPIDTIHISQRGGFGRTRITAQEQGVPALGQVVAAASIAAALDDAVAAADIEYRDNARIESVNTTHEQAWLRSADGTQSAAPLVVYAEGAINAAGDADSAQTETRKYGQHAVICTVSATTPHHHIAYERFTPEGPLALLPFATPNDYAVVYTCAPDEARRLVALSDEAFLAALQTHFGRRLRFVAATERHVFPLGLRYRKSPVGTRSVWLGNAAQTLHPVAGQGFNLALRDIRELARTLADQADPGAAEVLARYAAARRLDRNGVIGFTDSVVRLFSNDTPLLREGRGLALLALDLAPPLRSFVARRMMYGARGW